MGKRGYFIIVSLNFGLGVCDIAQLEKIQRGWCFEWRRRRVSLSIDIET